MAKHVEEIMNHELYSVGPSERAGHVLMYFKALEITAAPVVDREGRALGFVSLRDLVGLDPTTAVEACMSRPADTIAEGSTIQAVGERLANDNRHHLGVVDPQGRVVGYVSSLDVLRGLLGLPVAHPETFPHYDGVTGVTWTNDFALVATNVAQAPDGPGLLRVLRSRPGERDQVVWSEGTHNVRTRILDLLSGPQPQFSPYAEELERGALRFRAASTAPADAMLGAAAAIGLAQGRSTP